MAFWFLKNPQSQFLVRLNGKLTPLIPEPEPFFLPSATWSGHLETPGEMRTWRRADCSTPQSLAANQAWRNWRPSTLQTPRIIGDACRLHLLEQDSEIYGLEIWVLVVNVYNHNSEQLFVFTNIMMTVEVTYGYGPIWPLFRIPALQTCRYL